MLSLGVDEYNSKGPPQDMCNISINMIFRIWFAFFQFEKFLKPQKEPCGIFILGWVSICLFSCSFWSIASENYDGNAKKYEKTSLPICQKVFFSLHVVVFGFLPKTVNIQIGWNLTNHKPNINSSSCDVFFFFFWQISRDLFHIKLVNQVNDWPLGQPTIICTEMCITMTKLSEL